MVRKVFKIFDCVALLMWPLDPTSNGTRRHLKPLSSRSFLSVAYLKDFLKNAASEFFSKLQVSSSKHMIFSYLFKSTKSGLDCVTRISGGIVKRALDSSTQYGMDIVSISNYFICKGKHRS